MQRRASLSCLILAVASLLFVPAAVAPEFARLVTAHAFDPELKIIRRHNHLTQVYSVNTGDESLSAPLLDFLTGAAN